MGKIAAIGSLFLVTASDQISSTLIKNLIQRVRPCNELPDVNLLVFCSGSYSMPSSHAVNNFAVATYFSLLFPKYRWILIPIASIIAISRPYVGVHYPGDIIVGAMLGAVIGYVFARLIILADNYVEKKFQPKSIIQSETSE